MITTYLLWNYRQVNCEPLLLLEKNAQDLKQQSIAIEPNAQRNIDTWKKYPIISSLGFAAWWLANAPYF